MSTRFDTPAESAGFLLWKVTLRWQRLMHMTLRPFGLTHVQFVLLASLWWLTEHTGAPSQRQLADQAGTDRMMTSQVVRTLEQQGWVQRAEDATDARKKRLRLRPAGLALVQAALPAVEAADQEFFADCAQAGTFTHALRALAQTRS